tara:strand:- start:326 stop:763 length:438 start_codon:yes stop_codon:yes gene_type:complete
MPNHKKEPMRFREYINGGDVVLDIEPGEILEHRKWEPSEEGYDAQHVSWEACEQGITRTWSTWGRDCDGDIGSQSVQFCPWSKIKARTCRRLVGETWVEDEEVDWKGNVRKVAYCEQQFEDDPGWPEWEEESREHYDQYAQAMGY